MLDLPKLIDEAKAAKIKISPVHVNRASSVGHPCERFLVYCRTHWEQRKPHDVWLQRVFDLGKVYETYLLDALRDAGLYLEEQQAGYFDKRYLLSGHIDGKLPLNGHRYPVEAKSMEPFTWESINSLEDLRRHRRYYVRGYEDQLLSYLFLHEEEQGILLLVNKVSGQVKQILVPLDYQRMEEIIQKCERINTHVAANTLPDRIEWDEGICGRCAFLEPCYPDKDFGPGVEIIDDAELEAMLEKRNRLAQAAKEYEETDKAIKKAVQEKPHLVIGSWEIIGKWIDRGEYTVKASRYWQAKIKQI